MKSLKKTLVLLVVFSMILSAVMPAFAAVTDVAGLDCEEEVARLVALDVVSGFEDGTYKPEETITRAQMAVILCKMVGIDEVTVTENASVPSKFSDVAAGQWYTGHINVAAGKGLLSGFPDGTFRPNDNLTMNQVLTLCVNALGRGEYVSEMGTWPANYIAEATKLGLLDGVKSADANRGNVAIIAWNTLEAPYVWDVNQTEFEGTINLGNSHRSLLGIYFRNYSTEDGELKEIVEVEGFEVDDRQLVLDASDVEFADEFEKEPNKNKAEKSYKILAEDADGDKYVSKVRVYVPENVWEDLDELEDKMITLILGEDDVAVAVIIEDEVAEKDFLTAFESENGKEKVTVGGTKYKMDKGTTPYTVVVNGEKEDYTTMADALVALGVAEEDFDEIEKKIKAEIKLNDDEEVEKIELTASTYIDTISDEVLVTKVKETNSKYTITTNKGKITWSIEEENDGDVEFPKVYVDGVKADIRDIVPGMVISIFGTDLDSDLVLDDDEDLADIKVHVVTNGTIEGKADRIKKANLAITLEGSSYIPSNVDVTMSTEELSKYDGEKVSGDLEAVVDNDTVVLYLNMFGEYAFITLDEVASNWTYGVLTYVSQTVTFEGEDENIAVRNIKVLLDDGSKKTFKLKVDTDDDDTKDVVDLVAGAGTYTKLNAGDFVALDANADNVITIEDGDEVVIIAQGTVNKNTTVVMKELDGTAISETTSGSKTYMIDDYMVKVVGKVKADKDDEEFGAGLEYEHTSKTVIFNAFEKEIVSKWKSIIAADTSDNDIIKLVDVNTIAIFEDEEDETALYMLVALDENTYGNEDAVYAIVEESENVGDGENYVKFVGQEEMEAKDIGLLDEGWLVAYRTASSKVSEVQKLINIDSILDTKDIDTKKVYDYLFATCTIGTVGACEESHTAGAEVDSETPDCGCTTQPKTWKVGTANANCTEGTKHQVNDSVASGTLTCGCTAVVATWEVVTPYECADHEVSDIVASSAALDCGCTVNVEDIFFTLGSATPSATKFVTSNGTKTVIDTNTKIEQIVLDNVAIKSSGKITLEYVETEVNGEDVAIGSVKLDKDAVKVYDLRNGEVKEIDIDALVEEVNVENEDVYVIPAVNGDYDKDEGANVVFIVK